MWPNLKQWIQFTSFMIHPWSKFEFKTACRFRDIDMLFNFQRVKRRPDIWPSWNYAKLHAFSRCVTGKDFRFLALADPQIWILSVIYIRECIIQNSHVADVKLSSSTYQSFSFMLHFDFYFIHIISREFSETFSATVSLDRCFCMHDVEQSVLRDLKFQ